MKTGWQYGQLQSGDTGAVAPDKKVVISIIVVLAIAVSAIMLYLFYISGTTPSPPPVDNQTDYNRTCGNNVCEYFETSENCCKDCGCWDAGEVCDMESNRCERVGMQLSDERVEELVIQYFAQKGKEVDYMNITGVVNHQNKVGKNVFVYVKGQEWFIPVIVTDDEKVFEFEG